VRGGAERADLAGGVLQLFIAQLRRHLVLLGQREESSETKRLFEECQRGIERTLPLCDREWDLLGEARPLIETRGLTLVGVAVSNLDGDGNVQPPLPFDDPWEDRLDIAVDAVRERFGSAALTRAASLGRDLNPSVPILPD